MLLELVEEKHPISGAECNEYHPDRNQDSALKKKHQHFVQSAIQCALFYFEKVKCFDRTNMKKADGSTEAAGKNEEKDINSKSDQPELVDTAQRDNKNGKTNADAGDNEDYNDYIVLTVGVASVAVHDASACNHDCVASALPVDGTINFDHPAANGDSDSFTSGWARWQGAFTTLLTHSKGLRKH